MEKSPSSPIWLDAFIFRPTIGLAVKYGFKTLFFLRDQFLPNLEEAIDLSTVSYNQDGPFELSGGTDDGCSFRVTPERFVFSIRQNPTQKVVPGSWPEIIPPPKIPYSSLLESDITFAKKVIGKVPQSKKIKLNFIGLVAEGVVPFELAPPGLSAILTHFEKPWTHGIDELENSFLAILDKSKKWIDRCHHRIHRDKNKNLGQITVTLDFQRIFNETDSLTVNDFESHVKDIKSSFFSYIDKFGKGDLNYV